jgi:hypothetical protein
MMLSTRTSALVLAMIAATGMTVIGCDEKKETPKAGDVGKAAGDLMNKAQNVAGDMAKQATDAVAGEGQKMADSYLAKGQDLLKSLSSIKDEAGAKAAGPVVAGGVEAMNGVTALIEKLPDGVKTKVKELMGTKLSTLNGGLKEQIARLTGDGKLSGLVGDQLKKLKLWE